MEDELTLPRLPWDSLVVSRKRVRTPVSSDPVFSSEDDPSADNYTQERRKRKYRGPWYQQRLASDAPEPEKRNNKRAFERQYDSGIFMGSDGTDTDEAIENLELLKQSTLSLGHSRPFQLPVKNHIPLPEELARDHIERCLETGDETIDLSSRGLTTLSNSTIRPLATFTCVPPVTEGVFSQLEPSLKLFLVANELTTLPQELFNLETLNVLSLRGNSFHELPPAIGNLRNLRELNLSQNNIGYLPFEVLELFSNQSCLESLQLHPNPFFEPVFPPSDDHKEIQYNIGLGTRTCSRPRRGAVSCISSRLGQRSWHPRWKVTYRARTSIRYLGPAGQLVKGPVYPKTERGSVHRKLPVVDANDNCDPPEPHGTFQSRAPSLIEVALNACWQAPQLPNLPSFLHEECPPYLSDLLVKTLAKKESGGSNCTICNRSFIVPRVEWIEWWEFAKILDHKEITGMASAASPLRQKENERDVLERAVPLIRRSCSWLCVPMKGEVAQKEEDMNLDEQLETTGPEITG